ncbi:ABC transporter substrate-binding protein [Halorussus halophilus]|uniref:ABC transporter substrate-binding protein n=1 Tax=Halorussus halophilus TaxID=2650975 RepID=UPI001300FC60|nr:ABC transporter substrate-binding protein [Halorussus halophilus]
MTSKDTSISRRSFLKAAGGAAATASVTGYVGNDAEATNATQQGGGSVTYARGNDSGTLDPQNTTSGEDVKVINQMYDTLIDFEPNQTSLQEGLATEFSLNGTTATLTLREGVTFHNGDEFTAEDFVATFRRFTDEDYEYYPGDDYISAYGPFTLGNWVSNVSAGGGGGGTATGNQTETANGTQTAGGGGGQQLTIELNQQYAPFLRNLAMFASSVLSQQAIQELGQDLSQQPVGTSAFQFDSWDRGNQRIRLSAYDDYWGEGPFVDEVVFTAIAQNTTRAQTLISGGADIIDGLGAQSSQIVQNADAAELIETQGINIGYMAFNMARFEPFRDRQVRQAISHAINTQAIVENIFRGIAVQASQPIPEQVLGYNEELDPYPHDPEQAQQLLNDAGYGDGFSFELATFQNPRTYNPSPLQAAQTVKSNLNEVGITVNINQMPFNPFLDYTAEGRHDACFLGWMTDNGDPDNFYYTLLHPGIPQDQVPDGQDWVSFDTEGYNTTNVGGWANTDFMDVVEQGQSTLNREQRAELYRQAGQIAHDQAPWVFIDHAKELRGVANRVENFQIAPISGPLLKQVRLSN